MHSVKAQRGFLQNFILPGLIVLGIVVAGILLLVRGADMSAHPDQSNISAMVIISQSVRMQGAIDRALADGVITRAAKGVIDLSQTLMQSSIMPRAAYPTVPADALTQPADWQFAKSYFRVLDAQSTPQDMGTQAPDDVLFLPHVTASVCAHINYRLHGGDSLISNGNYAVAGDFLEGEARIEGAKDRAVPGQERLFREGCVRLNRAADYAYYKVMEVR